MRNLHKNIISLAMLCFLATLSSCALPMTKTRIPVPSDAATEAPLFNSPAISGANALPAGSVSFDAPSSTTLGFAPKEAADEIPVLSDEKEPVNDHLSGQITQLLERVNQLESELAASKLAAQQQISKPTEEEQQQHVVSYPMKVPVFHDVSGVDVVQDGDKLRVRVADDEIFLSGSWDFLPSSEVILKKIATELKLNFPEQTIGIEAHTDDLVGGKANPAQALVISTQKALLVSKFLLEAKLFEQTQLRVGGMGASQPIADNDTEAGRALNRRVEFVVFPPEK